MQQYNGIHTLIHNLVKIYSMAPDYKFNIYALYTNTHSMYSSPIHASITNVHTHQRSTSVPMLQVFPDGLILNTSGYFSAIAISFSNPGSRADLIVFRSSVGDSGL